MHYPLYLKHKMFTMKLPVVTDVPSVVVEAFVDAAGFIDELSLTFVSWAKSTEEN